MAKQPSKTRSASNVETKKAPVHRTGAFFSSGVALLLGAFLDQSNHPLRKGNINPFGLEMIARVFIEHEHHVPA